MQHHQAGRLMEAEQLYRQVLARQPQHANALHMLGVVSAQQGRHDFAVQLLRQTIALEPQWPQAHYNLGNALRDLGQLDQASAAYRQTIALKSDHYDARNNLGNMLKAQGNLDQAIAVYREILALNPAGIDADDNLVYGLHFAPDYDARAIAQEHRRWNQQHAAPLKKPIQPHINNRDPERRLRIGYVSPDFCEHCQSFFTIPLLSQHDRRNYQIVCYASVPRPDAVTARLQGYADIWRDALSLSDEQLAGQIRQDEIDILVDLTLHMAGNRLLVFARKPAPVQVTWLGYPGSTGLAAMDYRLSDPYLDPLGMDESIYSEQTIRLPDSFWCYDPLDGREIVVNALPALESREGQAGRVTFGCLNNFCKVNQGILALWAQVLRQVPNSRLLLLAPQGSPRQRLLAYLSQQGIDADRVAFFSHQSRRDYLAVYHRIDLGLDSCPYNGHTTSLDSFWMGVPVVTLVGPSGISRAGWCQLSNLGLAELAGQTPEQFVQIAVNLANDLPRLQHLRATLRQRMEASPLMDAPRFAGNIETAYRQMWRKWCAAGVAANVSS